MAGVIYSRSPGLDGRSSNENGTAKVEQTKNSAIGFSYSAGQGINYNLSKKLFLTLLFSYNGTNKMTYKDVKTTVTTSPPPSFQITFKPPLGQQSQTGGDGKQIMTSFNILVGIGFRLYPPSNFPVVQIKHTSKRSKMT